MFSWLFSFCNKESDTNEHIYRVRFSNTVNVRVIPSTEDGIGYLYETQYNIAFTPLNNSIRTADEFSNKLPVTDLNSNLHWCK